MEQTVRELLRDCRAHLDAELLNEIEANAAGGASGKSRANMRRTLDANALEIIEPLEDLIERIDVALADNRGDGI
jgi:hypothetical protein